MGYDIFDFDVTVECAAAPLYDLPLLMTDGILMSGFPLYDPTSHNNEVVFRFEFDDATIKFCSVVKRHKDEVKFIIETNGVMGKKTLHRVLLADAKIKSIKVVRVTESKSEFCVDITVNFTSVDFAFH